MSLRPAKDNSHIADYYLYKVNKDWWVSFYDHDDNVIHHDIDLISDFVFRGYPPIVWAKVVAFTKWGAHRIVKKFIRGHIKDFRRPPRPLP